MSSVFSSTGLKWLWLTALFLFLDQISKHYVAANMSLYESIPVMPHFNITYVHNLGAAFSFLADQSGWQRWFFATIALAASALFLYWLKKTPKDNITLSIAFSLMLSGAVGNLIDRVFLGYVIDFLDFYYQNYHWPAFNIADSAIFVGAFLMILDSFKSEDIDVSSDSSNIDKKT